MEKVKRVSLKEFIGDNSVLFSALAVFAGLSAFLTRLPINWLNGVLSFAFFTGMLIIIYEIYSNFPKDQNKISPRLFLFYYVVLTGLWGILIYWLLEFRSFWRIFLAFPLFIFLFLTIHSTFKPLGRINFLVKIFGIGRKKNTFQLILRDIYWIAIIGASLTYAGILAPIFNIILDFVKINFK